MEHCVEWKPFYSVGDASLDAEHQRLLGLIDDLCTAVMAGHGQDRVREILDRLSDYTMTHFDHEERVMLSCGYPNIEAHMTMHDEMRRRTRGFRAEPDLVVERDLLQFLKEWWVRHIQNQDKGYAPYLHALNPRPIKMA